MMWYKSIWVIDLIDGCSGIASHDTNGTSTETFEIKYDHLKMAWFTPAKSA